MDEQLTLPGLPEVPTQSDAKQPGDAPQAPTQDGEHRPLKRPLYDQGFIEL